MVSIIIVCTLFSRQSEICSTDHLFKKLFLHCVIKIWWKRERIQSCNSIIEPRQCLLFSVILFSELSWRNVASSSETSCWLTIEAYLFVNRASNWGQIAWSFTKFASNNVKALRHIVIQNIRVIAKGWISYESRSMRKFSLSCGQFSSYFWLNISSFGVCCFALFVDIEACVYALQVGLLRRSWTGLLGLDAAGI